MTDKGYVNLEINDGIGEITFFHAKGNSLPGFLLEKLAASFQKASVESGITAVILKSGGNKTFCAGASFDELISIENESEGKAFFLGFANVINSMRKCPKIIIAKVQGKAVGGGVGLAAASDYVFAHKSASLRLSEIAIGIGPFVVAPAIERKIGKSAFAAMTLDSEWRDANWAKQFGLYNEVFDTVESLDSAVKELARKLSNYNPESIKNIKNMFWEGTENWDELLERRAAKSGQLVISEFAREQLLRFRLENK